MKSEKWSVIRDNGVEAVCPVGTENTNNNETHDDMPAQRHGNGTTNRYPIPACFGPLYTARNPFSTCTCLTVRTSSVPAALPLRYRGLSLTLDLPLQFIPRCLPSTILGPRLNLGFCNVSTGAQSSYLLKRLLPSTRKVVLPGGTEIPDEPPNVMHRAHISEQLEKASPPQ